MTPEQHRARVAQTVAHARKRKRIAVNVYLEDWSNGVRDSPRLRVRDGASSCASSGVERIYLADTLGILSPDDASALRRA